MMTEEFSRYRGRFAPSPSGPLHFGSLVAALGSYLQARAQGGAWLVRIEDIDTPRTVAGASDDILRTLEQFGLHWDEGVIYQSQRIELYQDYFSAFKASNRVYGCECSRARIASIGGTYDGFCEQHQLQQEPLSWRLRSLPCETSFEDAVFGLCQIPRQLAHEHYIVRRKDGLFAYQWVVVIDDIKQKITEVIRGADLLNMTPRQQALFRLFQATAPNTVPNYGHLPLAVTAPGFKLSKQNHATDIKRWPAPVSLAAALALLGHPLPIALHGAPVTEMLTYAIAHWCLSKVPKTMEVLVSDFNQEPLPPTHLR